MNLASIKEDASSHSDREKESSSNCETSELSCSSEIDKTQTIQTVEKHERIDCENAKIEQEYDDRLPSIMPKHQVKVKPIFEIIDNIEFDNKPIECYSESSSAQIH